MKPDTANSSTAVTRAALLPLLLIAAACSQGPDASAGAAPTDPAAVTFQAQPDLAKGVEALPRLNGDAVAIEAINADLARRDAAARGMDCEGGGERERSASMPMTGPAYVTVWIAEGYFCEQAAHPSFDQTAITYDLATGRPVDWVVSAPGLRLTRGDTTDLPATYVPGLASPVLTAWYSRTVLADADGEWRAECGEVLTPASLDRTTFKVWLDARTGGVSVGAELPHVVQACAETATMTVEDMRRFGVSPAIIDAVAAAHAAGNWTPKDNS